jgi:uncharacterized membrane protein
MMIRRKWTKEEIQEYRKAKGTIFYYNKEDSNFIVPKAYGIGWTFNWASPISWAIALVIVGFIIFRISLGKA